MKNMYERFFGAMPVCTAFMYEGSAYIKDGEDSAHLFGTTDVVVFSPDVVVEVY